MDNQSVLTNSVKRMANAFVNAGVEAVVISPGSRSTPMAYAFASTKAFQCYMQVDERSAAFFALGMAKASRKPVILLCTSGTAASNYHPAVTEAFYARVPLIVLTADRPHELREVGAPQTIDQTKMFGSHVKWSFDMPLASEHSLVGDFIERQLQRSYALAMTAPMGPIHLNLPFREPLLIDFDLPAPPTTFYRHFTAEAYLSEEVEEQIMQLFKQDAKGLIIVGELSSPIRKDAFWSFAERLQWPVLCDPLSNLRSEVPHSVEALCIDHYDAILKSEAFVKEMAPEIVFRFGAQPVSKSLSLFLQAHRPATYIVVDESPQFRDSLSIVTHHLQTDAKAILQLPLVESTMLSYASQWASANDAATRVTESFTKTMNDEGKYVKVLVDHLPDKSDVISGSSMPIRDMDTFFRKTKKDIALFSNRGTNGIDGVVSTALGIQAARGRDTWLLIGDLSFLHDVNGLLVSRFHETNVTIVIMNNDGGGIFSYLPQSSVQNHYEQLFGTPTGLVFNHIAAMYDAQYAAIRSVDQFISELQQPKVKPIRIIEVFTNRQQNVKEHRDLWKQIVNQMEVGE